MGNSAIRVARNDLTGVVWLHLTLEWSDLFYALKRRIEENFEDTFYTGCATSDILEMPGMQTRSHQSVIREGRAVRAKRGVEWFTGGDNGIFSL